MAALYEVINDLRTILDTDDGELSTDLEQRLDGLQHDLTVKADNIARVIRQAEADAESYRAEMDRLAELQRASAGKAARLKRYLFDSLNALNIKRLDTPLFKLSVQANSTPSVTLREGADVPEGFERVKVELDAKAVLDAFKAGKPLPPELTVTVGSHLRLR